MAKFSYNPYDEDEFENYSYVTSEKMTRKKPRKSQF